MNCPRYFFITPFFVENNLLVPFMEYQSIWLLSSYFYHLVDFFNGGKKFTARHIISVYVIFCVWRSCRNIRVFMVYNHSHKRGGASCGAGLTAFLRLIF